MTTSGPSAVSGVAEMRLDGIAFAIGNGLLLTAPTAVGADEDFRLAPDFGETGVPLRSVELRDLATSRTSTAEVQAMGAAVLLALREGSELVPLPLSACAVEDADHLIPMTGAGDMAIRPVRRGPMVTHFRVVPQMERWEPARDLQGSPVMRGGRAVGILTGASEDGLSLKVTPVADIVDMLPPGVAVACDPRVRPDEVKTVNRDVDRLTRRIAEMGKKLESQESRTEAAEATMRITMNALADVADDLTQLQAAITSGGDVQPILNRMSSRLKPSAPLLTTVSTIESFLQRPNWRAQAKMDAGKLHLTFSYRTQMPGPRFSDQLQLCLRLIKPHQPQVASDHDFRSTRFYQAATRQDDSALVWCDWENIANPGVLTDEGRYIFETYRDDLNYMFDLYRAENDWIPEDREWSGLAYAALIKPASDATGEATDSVILRALILAPDDTDSMSPQPAECMLFETDQDIIDYLANRAPAARDGSLDDVPGLTLDPENTSDECVSSSVQ
ncbi:hypothetical protein [Paracoccus beibuensis]|uniref:hypothetical protein n=1 Tax=Paracoccus beibuensis TaxID=547602 RepID=UPI0022402035|nr:hypothetical protein [Paracoccus beibuensis]